jgi:hypothetical protein
MKASILPEIPEAEKIARKDPKKGTKRIAVAWFATRIFPRAIAPLFGAGTRSISVPQRANRAAIFEFNLSFTKPAGLR